VDRDDLWPDELLAGLETRAQPAGVGLVALGVVGGDDRHRALAAGVEVFALVLERFDSLAIKSILDCSANRFQGVPRFAAISLQTGSTATSARTPGMGLGLGHPEPPYLVPESIETLQAHDVVALEPGLYLPGVGGMRFERNYLTTDCGHETLTRRQLALTPRAELPRAVIASPSG